MDRRVFSAVTSSLLAQGLSVRFRAGGRSMTPSLRDGDVITVAPVDARDVALGDVVLCETWRGPIAHRVTRIERGGGGVRRLSTRGDASLEADRAVLPSQVRGRVTAVERAGRAVGVAIRGGALGRFVLVAFLRARPRLAALARASWAAAPAR